MAVQIPQLKRMEPQEPGRTGLIEAQAPDASRPFRQISSAIEKVGETTINYFETQERNLAQVKATEAQNEYEEWNAEQVYGTKDKTGLIHLDGDSTEDYAEFDKAAKKKQEEILAKYDYSPKVKGAIQSGLYDKASSLHVKRLLLYGAQFDAYDSKTVSDAVENNKRDAVDNLSLLDMSKPAETLIPFENNLNKIQELHTQRGLRTGSVKNLAVEGEEPIPVLNKSVQNAIAKDQSEAIYGAINNMLSAERADEAKLLLDMYSKRIDPVHKAKLTEAYTKLDIEQEGYKGLGEMEGKSEAEQKNYLKGFAKDPRSMKIKQKILELITDNERMKEAGAKRDSTQSYNVILNHIEENRRKGMEYITTEQLTKDPIFAANIGRVTDAKKKQALYEIVEKPKKDDPDVLTEMYDYAATREFIYASNSEIQEKMAGLTDARKKQFSDLQLRFRTETGGESRATFGHIASVTEDLWKSSGLLVKNRKGFETKTSEQERKKIQMELQEEIDMNPKMSMVDIRARAKKRIDKELDARKNSGESWLDTVMRAFGMGDDKKPSEAAPSKDATGESAFSKLSDAELLRNTESFKKANGRKPKDLKEAQEWFESEGAK